LRRPLAALSAVVLASSMALPARADRLDDDLNTVWESAWDQRGVPVELKRWEQPLRFRIGGQQVPRHRATIVAALTAATQAAGVALAEADAAATGEAGPNLVVEIVGEHGGLPDNFACEAQLRHSSGAIIDVRLTLRDAQVWECVFHEVMHAMGIPGHPSGKTVLSYFGWRRDVLLDLDRLLLATWYDRALPRGATPFEVLHVGGQRVARQPELRMAADEAERRRLAHYAARVAEMERFARGEGDVPMIIKRSGLASQGEIEDARTTIAHHLGLVHQGHAGMPKDDAKSAQWFARAAAQGHFPSQLQYARALLRGAGVPADAVEAHRWLAAASRAGSIAAHRELQQLEKTMEPAQLERARSLGPRSGGS
jgi:hypothetical protein